MKVEVNETFINIAKDILKEDAKYLDEFEDELNSIKSFNQTGDLIEFGSKLGLRFRVDHQEWLEGVFDRYMRSEHLEYYNENKSNVLEMDHLKNTLTKVIRNKYIELAKKLYMDKDAKGYGDVAYLKPEDQKKYKYICNNLKANLEENKEKERSLLEEKYLLEIEIMENRKDGKLYEVMFDCSDK